MDVPLYSARLVISSSADMWPPVLSFIANFQANKQSKFACVIFIGRAVLVSFQYMHGLVFSNSGKVEVGRLDGLL